MSKKAVDIKKINLGENIPDDDIDEIELPDENLDNDIELPYSEEDIPPKSKKVKK